MKAINTLIQGGTIYLILLKIERMKYKAHAQGRSIQRYRIEPVLIKDRSSLKTPIRHDGEHHQTHFTAEMEVRRR